MDWLSSALKIVRSPKLVAWVAATCAMLLYIPSRWFPGNFLESFRAEYGIYVTFALCAAVAMIGIELVSLTWKKRDRNKAFSEEQRKLLDRLSKLDPQEQVILREFFLQDRNTIKLPIESPVVAGLLKDGILQLVQLLPQRCMAGPLGSFRINPELLEIFTPEIVGLPQPASVSEEERHRIIAERPHFIREIIQRERIWEW